MDLQEWLRGRQEWPHQGHTRCHRTIFMTSICCSSIEAIDTLENGGTGTINRPRYNEEASGAQGQEVPSEHLQSEYGEDQFVMLSDKVALQCPT